jgi:hypothetical protein
MADDQIQLMEKTHRNTTQLMLILCFCYVGVIMTSLIVILFFTLRELNQVIGMMVDLDKLTCEEAAKPFKLALTQSQETLNETKTDHSIWPFFLYSNVVIFFAIAVAIIIVIVECAQMRN